MAVEKGADYLVIGRPITKNENPSEGFKKILEEISS
jgi:orotidine-5'-phosphate decarboxylase